MIRRELKSLWIILLSDVFFIFIKRFIKLIDNICSSGVKMADFNKEELSRLPLSERIKRLKELEEQRKKEMEEIEGFLEDSERELKTQKIAEDITPIQKEVDISDLFENEEEKQPDSDKPAIVEDDTGKVRYLGLNDALEDYEELKGITYASMDGGLTDRHMQTLDKIGERLSNINYQNAGKEIANVLVASKAALYKIKKYAGIDNQNF